MTKAIFRTTVAFVADPILDLLAIGFVLACLAYQWSPAR